jgi:hypothetical protein
MKALYDSVMADSKVSAEEWDSMNDSQRMEIAKEVIKHNPEIVKNSAKELMAKAETEASSFDGIKTGITAELEKKVEKISEYVDVTKDANGNLVLSNTGKLYNVGAELDKKMQEIPATLWKQFMTELRSVPNHIDSMKAMLKATPYVQSKYKFSGEPTSSVDAYVDVIAKANVYNNFFRQNANSNNNYLILKRNGDTVWDYHTAKGYIDALEKELTNIYAINPYAIPANGAFPSNITEVFWNGIAGGDLSMQSDSLKNAVGMFKENVSKSKEQIKTVLTNLQKEVDDYNKTKAAIDAVGALDNTVFSPDNIFKEVLMPITKQIESGGLTAVNLSKLPPGLAPFIKKTEGNIAYLDMGEFSGIPSLTELAEGATLTEQALPVTNEMGLAQGWTAPSGTIQGDQPAPIVQTFTPAAEQFPIMTGNEKYESVEEFFAKQSANDAAKGIKESNQGKEGIDLPWIDDPNDDEAKPSNQNNDIYTAAKKAAAEKFIQDIANGVDYKTALSNSWATFFATRDEGYKEIGVTGEPAVPKENREVVDETYEYEPEATGEYTPEGEEIYKSGNQKMV